MQIDQTNIFEFIKYLKEYITNNASNGNNSNNNDTESNNYKILKIRQYNNRVFVLKQKLFVFEIPVFQDIFRHTFVGIPPLYT